MIGVMSQLEKDNMSNWMSVLNEGNSEIDMVDGSPVDDSLMTYDPGYVNMAPIDATINKEQNKRAMVAIMESLSGMLDDPVESDFKRKVVDSFQSVTENVVNDARNNRQLKRGLQTQRTKTGFIYGEYELMERTKSEKKSYFSIRHTGTGEILVKDLELKESALILVELLNEGFPINTPRCLEALNCDNRYVSALFDMMQFKKKIRKGDLVAEDRYAHTRDKAVAAKRTAKNLIRSITG